MRRFIGASIVAILGCASAEAATCGAYPYALTNGTTADANQVMSNFNNILNCVNNNVATLDSPRFIGNVGINNSNPIAKLSVTATTAYGTNESFAIHAVDGINPAKRVGLGYDDNIDAGVIGSFLSGVGGENLLLNPSGGNVGIATTSPTLQFYVNGTAGGTSGYQVVSDARLKKNIQTIGSGLKSVMQLRPVSYQWRSSQERSLGKNLHLATGERQIGFIAQEVEQVVPEAVSKPKNASDFYSLKEENLIPVLVAAIKEQQAEIDQLRASLAALKH